MNILVTGAKGQLGNEIRGLSSLYPSHCYFFTDIEELDICDEEQVNHFFSENKLDLVINCAAYTAVDRAEEEALLCDRLNNLAPGYLARAAGRQNAGIIQVSTDYVFDGTSCRPYRETDPTSPKSVYGTTKLAGEQNVLAGCDKAVVIRTSWLYSAYGNNFVKTMLRLGKERESLGVIFDQVGTPTYAGDLAATIFSIIEKGLVRGIYHFSNEGVCSWYDFTKAIHRIAGLTSCKVSPLRTEDYPTKAKRPSYSVLDKTAIKQTYGIAIPYWEDSLEKCINILNK